jgi:hypothetical protein
MKFPQLPLGQRFEYQGETLVKVGAMTACNERGGNTRLIPRSAVVVPVAEPMARTEATAPLTTEPAKLALVEFEGRWRAMLEDLDQAARDRVERVLVGAQAELQVALGLAGRPSPESRRTHAAPAAAPGGV